MPIGPYYPGLDAYDSDFSGDRSFLASAPASWRGSVSFGVNDQQTQAMGAALQGILADMEGGQKTLGLPMPGPTIESPSTTTTVQAIEPNGVLTLSRNLAIPADAVAGYPVDHWVKIAEHVYLIRERPAANKIRVLPVAAASVGETVDVADIITVRLDTTSPAPIERDPEFWGPLSFQWIEA